MRSRSRFVTFVNEQEEQRISKRISQARKIVKKLSEGLTTTVDVIDPCKYSLMFGSLWRALTGVESCFALLSQGYIGSTNAMLRQILEHLYWAKLGIEADEDSLVKLNAMFFDESLVSHPVTRILGITEICDFSEDTSGVQLKNAMKEVYHRYSLLTHATYLSQQNPYKTGDFYEYLNRCLTEVCILLDAYIAVYKQYCQKICDVCVERKSGHTVDFLNIKTEEDRAIIRLCFIATKASEIMGTLGYYHENLIETQGNLFSSIQMAFMSKWVINKEKLLNSHL